MIYKTLKKVSNVCQVLDKSKYPATQTVNGVTFTNNGDGSWTISGKPTSLSYLPLLLSYPLKQGHTYLSPAVIGSCYIEVKFINKDNAVQWGKNVYTADENSHIDIGFIVLSEFDGADKVLIPQLFDLTEMYGAGNEPTTVEQFRQDFPDEMYDYKPYCFVKSYKTLLKVSDDKIITSYKKSLVCKTKNLFDISKVPIISGELTVKDNSICSYYYPVVTNDTNLLSIFKSLKPNTNYTMSATTLNYLGAATNYIVLIFSNANDDKIIFYNYSAGFNKVTFSLTQEQINNITYVYFYGRDESSGGPVIWNNIQLELGDTATEYHPYGCL